MTSIEQRLQRINRALTLIAAAAHGCDPETGSSFIDDADTLDAIKETAVDVLDDVYWLKILPGTVVRLPAPSDEELDRDLPGTEDIPDRNAARERIINEALRAPEKGGAR